MSDQSEAATPAARAEVLRAFVRRTFPLARKKALGDDHPLLESGIVDSLGILELVNFVTETFGVHVTDEDLLPENFNSIGSLIAFVERKERETGVGDP